MCAAETALRSNLLFPASSLPPPLPPPTAFLPPHLAPAGVDLPPAQFFRVENPPTATPPLFTFFAASSSPLAPGSMPAFHAPDASPTLPPCHLFPGYASPSASPAAPSPGTPAPLHPPLSTPPSGPPRLPGLDAAHPTGVGAGEATAAGETLLMPAKRPPLPGTGPGSARLERA